MNKKILLANADLTLLNFLSKLLTYEGYTVFTTTDGNEVIEMTSLIKPDLILVDTIMPGLMGLEICEKIRERCNQVPVVILSAKNEVRDRIMAFYSGCDDYLAKPFDTTELLLRIRAVLRRTSRGAEVEYPASVVEARGITMNRITRSVVIGHKEITLTAKEFELLWLFMNHSKQVFTREQLAYHVWNTDFCGDASAINMLVKRLRTKIEDNTARPKYIQTVRGVGYKFDK